MGNLEKFIKAHRDQFDDSNPDPALWDRIASRLPQQRDNTRRIIMWKWIAAAAVVVALVMSGVVAGLYMGRGTPGQNPDYAEFMQAQQYYNLEYNKKKSELSHYAYDPMVDKDLNELDEMYTDLSKEFMTTDEPDKSELINAMIQIYKSRIALLECVLNRIEQSNNEIQLYQDEEKVKI